MSFTLSAPSSTIDADAARSPISPTVARLLVAAGVIAGTLVGFLATDPIAAAQAMARAGEGLTYLLRAMATIKAAMALAVLAGAAWRLASPVTTGWLAGYVAAGAVMAAGPGLIWNMVHIGVGAMLLHAGLIGMAIMLWRDPAVTRRLSALIEARRRA